jgi:hypothetical protein
MSSEKQTPDLSALRIHREPEKPAGASSGFCSRVIVVAAGVAAFFCSARVDPGATPGVAQVEAVTASIVSEGRPRRF